MHIFKHFKIVFLFITVVAWSRAMALPANCAFLKLTDKKRMAAVMDYNKRKRNDEWVPQGFAGQAAKRPRHQRVSDLAADGFLPGDGSVCELVVRGFLPPSAAGTCGCWRCRSKWAHCPCLLKRLNHLRLLFVSPSACCYQCGFAPVTAAGVA